MKKKNLLTLLLLLVTLTAQAQWKVASCQRQSASTQVLQLIPTPEGIAVYATFHPGMKSNFYLSGNEYVKANGKKYRLKNSVNLPFYDEAEPRYLVTDGTADESYNIIMFFQNFPTDGDLDFVFDVNLPECSALGVRLEPLEQEQVLRADEFLEETPVTISGSFVKDGSTTQYMIHDGVTVTCKSKVIERDFLSPNSKEFTLTIENNSDRGVLFDFNKLMVKAIKEKKGKKEEVQWYMYSPDSYESARKQEDYAAARAKVGGDKNLAQDLRREADNTKPGWEKIGTYVLADMVNKQADNKISEYLRKHKNDRPQPMKTTSIKAGEVYSGYVASQSKKCDTYTIYIPLGGYTYQFTWK